MSIDDKLDCYFILLLQFKFTLVIICNSCLVVSVVVFLKNNFHSQEEFLLINVLPYMELCGLYAHLSDDLKVHLDLKKLKE